jgi:ADP-heptose:LPS heptosyltransferase
MDIPISFKIYLQWKNLFNKKEDNHQIKISKEGRGVRSILFFLPEKIQDAKIVNYLVKVENPLPGYDIGLVCSERSKMFYPHIDSVKLFTFNDEDLNRFDTIKSVSFMDKIGSKNYDAIVDLNTEFCAATTMLAFELDAPLKIGFDSIVNRKIFTITMERKENTFLESYFSRILNLLGVKL